MRKPARVRTVDVVYGYIRRFPGGCTRQELERLTCKRSDQINMALRRLFRGYVEVTAPHWVRAIDPTKDLDKMDHAEAGAIGAAARKANL